MTDLSDTDIVNVIKAERADAVAKLKAQLDIARKGFEAILGPEISGYQGAATIARHTLEMLAVNQ